MVTQQTKINPGREVVQFDAKSMLLPSAVPRDPWQPLVTLLSFGLLGCQDNSLLQDKGCRAGLKPS